MLVAAALLVLSVCLATTLFIWRRNHFNYFKKLGIPGPTPNWIWGNLLEYHSMESYKVVGKWIEEYGNVFGFFNGDVPFVVLNDLDFIEYVYVRNFRNFVDRGNIMVTNEMHPVLGKSLLHAGGAEWKKLRSPVARSLSAAKLKLMVPQLEEDAELFTKSLEEYADTDAEIHMLPKFEELAMDYTARGAFGIEEHFQGNPDHPLIELSRTVFVGLIKGPLHMIGQCTTTIREWMKPFYWFTTLVGEFTFENLGKEIEKVIEMRKKDPSLRKADILQNLIDAEGTDTLDSNSNASKSSDVSSSAVAGTATLVFIAGFESLATALSYVTFALAKYPDIQKRVREEVLEALSQTGTLNYEIVMKKLKYLGYVVNETLRLYPPGLLFVTRKAKEDFEYKGMKYKAGTCFVVSTYHLHTNPQFWPNAEQFYPERFAPENEASLKKLAYAAFGIGPRNCVGVKLSLLIVKYTIANIVRNYHLELGDSQMGSMELTAHATVSVPGRGPWIKLYRV
ncbi:cytochrome P450 3A2-like isoform X2 [Dermacentor albipictus]|uniref:cytochrome P450 3A2-like isoform X2 n=1 Tax=Dermacentor albipictus TaxID=60249 RepID=UPI0038FCEEA9